MAMKDIFTACGVSAAASMSYVVPVAMLFFASTYIYVKNQGKSMIRAATEKVFNTVDVDQSGSVDSKELELAVTMLYAEINKYVRVKRPEREHILGYVDKIDVDRNGTLDRAEFNVVMKLMCENVAFRISLMFAAKLASPFIAEKIVESLARLVAEAGEFLVLKGVLGGSDCAVAFVTQATALVNKATLETMVALVLISVVAPALFDWWDNVLIVKIAAKAEGLRRLPASKPTSEKGNSKSKPPRHEGPLATRAQDSASLPYADKLPSSSFNSVENISSVAVVAVVAVVVLLTRHLLSCRPDFESFMTSHI